MTIEGLRVVHTLIKTFWDVMLFVQQVLYQTTQHLMPEDHYDKEKTT
jgi:hypothetical protein